MFKVGDKVFVIDQRPPAEGEVIEVSTWRDVIGPPAEETPCYKVKSPKWATWGWIGQMHLEARS